MSQPVVTIIGPGKRPDLWWDMVDRMARQDVAFEWIISGPHPPVREMPKNFTYLYSVLKPHQKHILCAKAARSPLLMYWNDDWVLSRSEAGTENIDNWRSKTPRDICEGTIKPLVDAWEACAHPDAVVAPTMPRSHPYLFFAGKVGYLLPFAEVFAREAFFRHQTYDRRFIAIYAGNEYCIRMQAAGVPVKILPQPFVVEMEPGGLWGEYWWWDRSFKDALWIENYPVRPRSLRYRSFDGPVMPLRKTRALPMEGYDVDAPDLAYVHQGPRGKWKNTCRQCYEDRQGGCLHVEQPTDPSWTAMIGRPEVEDVPAFSRVATP